MDNALDSVYMIICTDMRTKEKSWHNSGRGYTPFTTVNFGRAKGELTRCNQRNWCTCELVKVDTVKSVM